MMLYFTIFFTSDYIEDSTSKGDIPAIKGTGEFKYSLREGGRTGIRICSHWKGKRKEVNASKAYPSTVLDWETKMMVF